jgi:hypothetical protein
MLLVTWISFSMIHLDRERIAVIRGVVRGRFSILPKRVNRERKGWIGSYLPSGNGPHR